MPVVIIPDQPPDQLQIWVNEQPPTSGPDGRFQVAGEPGARALAILGHKPTLRRGLALEAGKTIDLGDITADAGANSAPRHPGERVRERRRGSARTAAPRP
jgi:hypothetical protein